MNKNAYLAVSGVVFLLVAAGHTARAIRGTNILVGLHRVPLWGSWIVAAGAALLAIWAFSSRRP